MQTASNSSDLFPDHKSVNPNSACVRAPEFLVPSLTGGEYAVEPAQIYWVSSPTSGRVSKEIQDFVLHKRATTSANGAEIIDSRTLVSYPYHHMEPDKEHFIGADMDTWADKVYEIVEARSFLQQIASLTPLAQTAMRRRLSPN